MSLTLISPKLLSIRNRWRLGGAGKGQFGRDSVLAIFSILVMLSIYFGLNLLLSKISSETTAAYLHPSMVLDILLLFLYAMLFFSNAVSAIGTLFLSADLPLLKASPIGKTKIFLGKLLETLASSTWMVVVFGLPGLVAFTSAYNANLSFVLLSIITLIPYFVIPAALSMLLVTIVAAIIPISRTKEVFAICGFVMLLGAYFVIDLLFRSASKPIQGIEDILYLIEAIRTPNAPWFPSHWVALIMGNTLIPTATDPIPYHVAIWGLGIFTATAAYIAFILFHDKAYSMSQSTGSTMKAAGTVSLTEIPPLSWIFKQQERAILSKDMSTFLRDFSQSIQLMLLLGLCTFYLYNLRILRVVDNLPLEANQWWQSFLVLGNLAMGTFVLAAICTRFVFPSMSLEGKSYWILKSSCMSLKSILKSKFKIWYLPMSVIGSTLLASGAMAIQADLEILLLSGTICWITSIGLIGLGLGLGSVYANFDWEHSSQLAASFGSLVYMLCCTMMIALNMLPVALLIVGKHLHYFSTEDGSYSWYIALFFVYVFLINLNRAVANWALRVGEKSLAQRDN